MLTLHLRGERASLGLLDPSPPGHGLRVYDFGTGRVESLDASDVMAVGTGDPAAVSFAPELDVQRELPMAANKVVRLPTRRKRPVVPTSFVTGYERFAAPRAAYWREHGVGTQPLLAAGVFSLSSIQVPIVTTLKLFSMLTPHVIDDELPTLDQLQRIVKRAGAGLHSKSRGRPRWYAEYERYRFALSQMIDIGLRDDDLRYAASVETPLPLGLGLAKLSFTLALVGNDCGCLDARIIGWAFTKPTAKRFADIMSRKRADGSVSPSTYGYYVRAEKRILVRDSPFFDPESPVGIARSQWMLWESLGADTDRTHTHEELFAAVVDDRLDRL